MASPENIVTDADLVRIARQMETHFMAIRNLLLDLEDAPHPGAKDFLHGLDQNMLTAFAWPEHIVHSALIHPERWQTDSTGIHFIGRKGGQS